jgi:hypothetical protein
VGTALPYIGNIKDITGTTATENRGERGKGITEPRQEGWETEKENKNREERKAINGRQALGERKERSLKGLKDGDMKNKEKLDKIIDEKKIIWE